MKKITKLEIIVQEAESASEYRDYLKSLCAEICGKINVLDGVTLCPTASATGRMTTMLVWHELEDFNENVLRFADVTAETLVYEAKLTPRVHNILWRLKNVPQKEFNETFRVKDIAALYEGKQIFRGHGKLAIREINGLLSAAGLPEIDFYFELV